VVFELEGWTRESAVLACDCFVHFFFVVFFVGFGDALCTLAALVILSGAAYVVHPKLAEFYVLEAERTLLRLFLSFH